MIEKPSLSRYVALENVLLKIGNALKDLKEIHDDLEKLGEERARRDVTSAGHLVMNAHQQIRWRAYEAGERLLKD